MFSDSAVKSPAIPTLSPKVDYPNTLSIALAVKLPVISAYPDIFYSPPTDK